MNFELSNKQKKLLDKIAEVKKRNQIKKQYCEYCGTKLVIDKSIITNVGGIETEQEKILLKKVAQGYIDQGYRKVSIKYRIIIRIDREDWVEEIYKKRFGYRPAILNAVKSFYKEGFCFEAFGFMKDTVMYEAGLAADYYRRTLSKDRITGIPDNIFRLIPSSSHDVIGYIPRPNVPIPPSPLNCRCKMVDEIE